MYWYASRGSEEERRALLLDSKSGIKARKKYGMTPLHFAARYNTIDVAVLLLQERADVNAKFKYMNHHNQPLNPDHTPLHIAALKRQEEMAKLLIDNNADIDAKDRYGNTPLHFAACNNAIAVAKLLVGRGADMNAKCGLKSHRRKTAPLHVAARNNAIDVAKLLVESGVDVSARGHDESTPLCDAVKYGNIEMINWLVGGEVDLDPRIEFSLPIYDALRFAQNEGVAKLLIRHMFYLIKLPLCTFRICTIKICIQDVQNIGISVHLSCVRVVCIRYFKLKILMSK